MSYPWEKRVEFIIRYMYDIDNNGFLDQNDFDCMAVRATVMEGQGECDAVKLAENQHIMRSLWEEISELADFDKDGQITTGEFKEAVQKTCIGRKFSEFPQAMKAFIDSNFKLMDTSCDGIISAPEYRYNCISRIAVTDVKVIDNAFDKLLNDEDRKRGGLTLSRYQELYSEFLGNTSDSLPSIHLFGPILD